MRFEVGGSAWTVAVRTVDRSGAVHGSPARRDATTRCRGHEVLAMRDRGLRFGAMTDQPAGEAKVSAPEDPEKKPEPIDQLVETDHVLDLPDGELAYTARTGPGRAARGGLREGRLHRLEAAGGDGGHRLHPRRGRRDRAPGLLRLQRRSGVGLGVAAPRAARTAPGRHGRRRRPGPAAVRAGRQRRDPAPRRRPGLHRPDVDRAHARRRGWQGEGLPRLRQGRGAGRRADPALVHP